MLQATGETARGFIGDESLAAATNGQIYAGVGFASVVGGLGLFYGGSLALSGITAGAAVAGTTVGTYLGTQAIIAGLETGVEYGASSYFGDSLSTGATIATFGKNFVVNALTGGLGGAATTAGKIGLFAGRQAIEIGADTAFDVARGGDFTTSLLVNSAGSLGGEAIFRGLGRAANSKLAHQAYAYAGGFRRGFFSAGQSSIYVGSFLGGAGDFGRRFAVVNRMGIEEAIEGGELSVVGAVRAGAARTPRHHVFSQRLFGNKAQTKAWFIERGVDIDRITLEITAGEHEAIHKWVGTSGWNRELRNRLLLMEATKTENLTAREIWE